MQKYIFKIACGEQNGDTGYRKIELEKKDDPTKIIKFCDSRLGSCYIHESDSQEFFRMWVMGGEYNFRASESCDQWTDEGITKQKNASLLNVKLKVILDIDCEYKIAVSDNGTDWITLPKSLLFDESLNLKRYYNQELILSKGEKCLQHPKDGACYIAKVMYGETEVCKLAPLSFPHCIGSLIGMRNDDTILRVRNYTIVVEKNGGGELSVYLADNEGAPARVEGKAGGSTLTSDISRYVNSSLKTALLENSNIREVLPELGIDDDVSLDKRKLKCLISRMHNADLVAKELVTNKADELGRAVLKAKDGEDKEILVNSSILQEGVAEKLRTNPGNTKGPRGEDANSSEIVNRIKHDSRFKREVRGEKGDTGEQGLEGKPGSDGQPGPQGPKGENANSSEIVNRIKHDSRFKREVRGEKGDTGEQGPPGNDGPQGLQGPRGEDANSSEIVNRIKHDSRFKREVRGEKGDTGEQGLEGKPGSDGQPGPQGLKGEDANPSEIVNRIKHNSRFKREVRGEKGDTGEQGPPGNNGSQGPQGPKGEDANSSEIVNRIKHDSRFKREVRGEKGDTGAQGQSGKDGESPPAKDVAAQLLTDGNKDTLATEIASNEGLQKAVADNQNLKTAVTTDLKGDGDFQAIIKGERGEKGEKGDPGNDVSIKHRFTLQKGEKLSEDIYEANIVLNGKTMAVLPKIGYYDRLVMRNHVTNEEVAIPRDFHYLKVVKLGSGFDSDDYKLTFCNVLGNQFFEYKKYDPQYSNISDEYKFISLSCAKREYDLNLSELLSYQPLFFITEGSAELDLGKHSADVFELTHAGKGRKMATLIDEFGYFDQNGMFMHCNYHEETEYRSYNSAEIDKEYKITAADSEFYLDNIILHTTPPSIIFL